jgi:hypothetical protein
VKTYVHGKANRTIFVAKNAILIKLFLRNLPGSLNLQSVACTADGKNCGQNIK